MALQHRPGMVYVQVTGLKEVIDMFKRADTITKLAIKEALEIEAAKVLDRATDLVPLQTGRLMSSGRIIRPPINSKVPLYHVVYGGINVNGRNVDYAMEVHEEPQERRKTGQSKYLQKAFTEVLQGIENRIQFRISKAKFF